jgi:16S rRNA (guanine966-N2)-methyltransferase
LRIISGTYKGKKLLPFPGKTIRPTSDRLREALFNILADKIQGALVLDLFAGTGALGIEALSRGAGAATFIEKDASAVLLLKKNIHACGLEENVHVIQWDILTNLNCIQSITPGFNLVFMDPPYQKDMVQSALRHLSNSNALQNNACLVIEHSKFDPIPNIPKAFQLKDERKYGKTLVSFLEYMV